MITTLLVLSLLKAPNRPSVADLDALAQARNYEGLSAFVNGLPKGVPNPLQVLKTNGAYECGRFGWHAYEIPAVGRDSYVAVSTPLTSEDIGDFLFKRVGDRLTYVPEDHAMGIHIEKNVLDVTFEIPQKRVRVTDDLTIEPSGSDEFVFRMSNEFQVRSITDSKGTPVKFSQGGGIVLVKTPAGSKSTLHIVYDGVVDRPLYSASISANEGTLTNCYWYPLVARQPAPYEVTVHYPKEWVAIGQGVKLSEKPGESHFKMDLPCVFYSLSVGPYKTGEYKDGDKTFYSWSPRLSKTVLEAQAETYASIVKFYSRFSPFPFKTYGGLDSPQYGGGALEAYSYATYGGGFPEVDGHEPSHTWWGGILNNTYLHSFWNESFAVFSENFYRREWPGSEGNRIAFIPRGEVDRGYDQIPCDASGADRGGIASSLGYGKGSHVLFLLQQLIGTDAMVRSMARFVKDEPAEKGAEWEDFERGAIKENPTKHLETFFADWLHRPGHLEMDASAAYSSGVVQVDYKPVGEPFRVPLQVLLAYADGKQLVRTFDVREAQSIKIPSAEKPLVISVDPYRFLIRKVHADEEPETFSGRYHDLKVYIDPSHKEWGSRFENTPIDALQDLNGVLVVGSPETVTLMKGLCAKVGFEVVGNRLTYKGKTIDLNHGGAEALVDLGDGKVCGIALGKTRIDPDIGEAKVAIFDDLGRMVDGETNPKTSGFLTWRP